MKRKFRKLWRRFAREEEQKLEERNTRRRYHNPYARTYNRRALGMGKRHPSRAQKKARKDLVRRRLWELYIQPAIRRFEEIDYVNKVEDE